LAVLLADLLAAALPAGFPEADLAGAALLAVDLATAVFPEAAVFEVVLPAAVPSAPAAAAWAVGRADAALRAFVAARLRGRLPSPWRVAAGVAGIGPPSTASRSRRIARSSSTILRCAASTSVRVGMPRVEHICSTCRGMPARRRICASTIRPYTWRNSCDRAIAA